jgi:hypothetical protein
VHWNSRQLNALDAIVLHPVSEACQHIEVVGERDQRESLIHQFELGEY